MAVFTYRGSVSLGVRAIATEHARVERT